MNLILHPLSAMSEEENLCKQLILPYDVSLNILVRIDGHDDEYDFLGLEEILGLDLDEIEEIKATGYYRNMKFYILKTNHGLIDIYSGGHKKRVKNYNILVKRMILRSPERFVSLTAPYSSHKFLLERESETDTREPAFYYPIDEDSVDFWNRVHDTDRLLKRFQFSNLWRRRNGDGISCCCRFEGAGHIDDSISGVAFKMEHHFARVLLKFHFEHGEK